MEMEWLEEVTSLHSILYFLLPLTLLLAMISTRRRRKLPFPPGPPGLPIIGNMLMMDQLTHRGLAKLAERYGGLCHLRLGFLHAFAVSTPEIARQVLQAQDSVFSNRPATIAITYLTYDRADMAFAHYGPFWRQMRKLCVMKLFSKKRAESWASVREEVDAAARAVADRAASTVNVGELVFNLTKNITFRAAFGSQSHKNQEQFISILQEFSKLFGAFNVGDFISWLGWIDLQGINWRLKEARGSLDGFIDTIIDDHLANPKEADAADADMVDDMLAFLEETSGGESVRNNGGEGDELQGSFRLTRNNIKAIIMDVMFGGTETVASAIEWAMAELMRSPDDMRRVQEELATVVGLHRKVNEGDLDKLSYLKCVVKETLRLHPPIPLLLHETAEDSEVAGFHIPARSRVMINVWAIARDESAWKDATAFRPSRFGPGGDATARDFKGSYFEFLPFGSGRRSCPGMQLGLHALELAVAQLAHCFTWELPDGMKPSELDMGDVFGLTAPRAKRLMAVPTPRLACPLD
ncbi:Cytochrome P450 [Canna indica]|uniref:Cytochrome P450 n=1 Tax=Canna indica TaxID=4628 RepID=A0AAQ3QJL9_9LILI|nr:Cytochrome P450 [Canna indica]